MADMHPDLLTLNDDVLELLVSYLDSASARRLSYTARGVHLIAKHQALKSVTLHSIDKVAKFCTYMLTDMPHYLSALYELRLHCKLLQLNLNCRTDWTSYDIHGTSHHTNDEAYATVAANLTSLLRGSKHLRVIVIDNAEAWMVYQPDMADVLSSMQTLQDVELGMIGARTLDFIHRMQSTPRRMAFDIRIDPSWLLMHNLPRRLSDLRQAGTGNSGVSEPYLHLPSVEVLVAHSDLCSLSNLVDLAQAFPSTKYLDMKHRSRGDPFDLLDDSNNRHLTTQIVAWPSLERVRCTLSSFDGWASITVIHLLQVVDQLANADKVSMPSWRGGPLATGGIVEGRVSFVAAIPVVRSLQPVALVVDIDVDSDPRSLARVVKSSSRLRYLAIRVSAKSEYRQMMSWWITLFSALSTDCNIVCVEFLVGCDRSKPQRMHSSNEGPGRILQALVQRIPLTIRYISLETSLTKKPRWRYNFLSPEQHQEVRVPATLQWWSRESAGHVRAMKSLDAVRGERIAAYLRSTQYDHNQPFDERNVPGL